MSRTATWVAVTTAAVVIFGGALHFPGTLDDVGPEVGPLVFGGVTGLLVGAAQLVPLRGRLRHRWRWPAATAAGMAITHGIGDGVSADVGYVPVAVIGGLAIGVLQALVLRMPIWGMATAAAFAIGIAGGNALAFALGFNSIFEEDAARRAVIIVGATGVLYGLFTAPLLARIRWRR